MRAPNRSARRAGRAGADRRCRRGCELALCRVLHRQHPQPEHAAGLCPGLRAVSGLVRGARAVLGHGAAAICWPHRRRRRTKNGKGRHLSTARAIQILEEHGAETPEGRVRLLPELLSKATANRHLRQWRYDHGRMTHPPATARHPNPSKGRVPSFCDQSTVRLPSSFEDLLYHVAVAFLLGTAWTTAWPPASRVRQVLVRTERVAHRSVCGPRSCA